MDNSISTYEAERWRQLSDELTGQYQRLKATTKYGTRDEWSAIGAIEDASRSLFAAFAWVMRDMPET